MLTPGLPELQRAMREGLVEGEDDDLRSHVVADGLDASQRLDVYRNTYASVLTTALRLSYPAVHRLVGADFFEGAARVFITAHPPSTACLDLYGAQFAAFLADFDPARSLEYLPDVARLEWAVNRALHAHDAPPLSPDRLRELAGLDGAQATLVAHPAVSTLRSQYPVDVVWRAVLDEDGAALGGVDLLNDPTWLLVERTSMGVNVQRMAQAPWRFTAALCGGATLDRALAEATDFDPTLLLADHFAKGRFIDVRPG
jgi:Putative DNA-binding domain